MNIHHDISLLFDSIELPLELSELLKFLETPQDRSMWDAALPCFQLAKIFKNAPQMIATDLAKQLNESVKEWWVIARVEAAGPYVNFFVNPAAIAADIIGDVQTQGNEYWKGTPRDERIIIESPGPNTNKPLHLGHVRNMLLGNSLWSLLKFAGFDVHTVDIVNDRWVHICKSMLAYKLFADWKQPDKKGDHFVGDWYVRFSTEAKEDETLEQQAQEMLQQREAWDEEVVGLWREMCDWCLKGMYETYARYWTHIEKVYYESDHYLKGKAIVEAGLESGLFVKNAKWNVVYTDHDLGDKTVLRSDGTAIYITQDLALAQLRYDDWNMDRMIYVVGNEQADHFRFLFSILKTMKLPFAEKCHHLSYGYVSLPDGRMKSREGNVVDADNLIEDMHMQSYDILKERYPDLADTELHTRAEKIAMAAVKFFVLKYDATKDFVFDRENSLRFDGETGPYIQYTYARCSSILAKAWWVKDAADYTLLITDQERLLLLHINSFGDVVQHASDRYQPYMIARYALDLAQLFNTYYQHHTINDADNQALSHARLWLVASIQQLLNNALTIVGIELLDQM